MLAGPLVVSIGETSMFTAITRSNLAGVVGFATPIIEIAPTGAKWISRAVVTFCLFVTAGSQAIAGQIFEIENAVFLDGTKLTGTVTIDTVLGSVTAINLVETYPSSIGSIGNFVLSFTGYDAGDHLYEISSFANPPFSYVNSSGTFHLINEIGLPVTTLVGYHGGKIVPGSLSLGSSSLTNFIDPNGSSPGVAFIHGDDLLNDGASLVPVPEPCTWTLASLGIMFGVCFRRRIVD